MAKRKKFKCSKCKKEYIVRKGNFSKNKQSKSGYAYHCKTCCDVAKKDWLSRQTPEKLKEIASRQRATTKKHRDLGKYNITEERYKKRRNELRRLAAHKKRQLKRLREYEKKFYWTEEQSWYKNDIQPHEY
jgi:hypothetical protein